QWALEHENWTAEQWSKVVWSDQCTVVKTDGERQCWVFRTCHQKWEKDMIQGKIFSKGVSQMVWGAFSRTKTSGLVICEGDPLSKREDVSGRVYLQTLKDNLPELMSEDSIFMHDNAP